MPDTMLSVLYMFYSLILTTCEVSITIIPKIQDIKVQCANMWWSQILTSVQAQGAFLLTSLWYCLT